MLQTWKKSQACKHCLQTVFEKIVDIFGSTTIFLQYLPSNAQESAFLSTINHFCKKIIELLGTFIFLGSIGISTHFLTPKIDLRTKINFFHVWSLIGVNLKNTAKNVIKLVNVKAYTD